MITEEEVSVKARLKALMENTSAHGLGSIDRAGKWGVRKLFWSIVVSFALAMFFLQLYWIGTQYINKDVAISVDLRYSRRLHFPAITFCNLNPIKASALDNSVALKSLLSNSGESSTAATNGQVTSVIGSEDSPVVGEAMSDGNSPGGTGSSSSVNSDGKELPANDPSMENVTPLGPEVAAGSGLGGDVSSTTKGLTTPSRSNPSIHTPVDTVTPKFDTSSGTALTKLEGTTKETSAPTAMAGGPGPPPMMPGKKKKRSAEEDASDSGYGDWSNVNYKEKSEKFNLFLQVTDTVASVPYEEREALGHDIWDMLLSCTWKGITCSPYNFTHFFNYKHGNCYTFNSGMNGSIEISSKSGPLYGLTLELFLEQFQYIANVQQAAGMRVSIHDQGTMPFPESNGISIQPGTETSIGVRSVRITREPEPYGDCVSPSADDLSDNIFTRFFDANYTLESCEKNCLYYQILETCHCADARFRYDIEYPPCLSTNSSQVACQEDVEAAYVNEELDCQCANPCRERVFETTISSARWPNDQHKPTVISQLAAVSEDIRLKFLEDEDFIERNVLKLNVYFEHLNYESIAQSPAYTELDCLSDIGGQVGLWIGFSVITWFEMGEFVIDVLIILCKKMFKTGQRRQTAPLNSDLFDQREKKMEFEMNREMTVSNIAVS